MYHEQPKGEAQSAVVTAETELQPNPSTTHPTNAAPQELEAGPLAALDPNPEAANNLSTRYKKMLRGSVGPSLVASLTDDEWLQPSRFPAEIDRTVGASMADARTVDTTTPTISALASHLSPSAAISSKSARPMLHFSTIQTRKAHSSDLYYGTDLATGRAVAIKLLPRAYRGAQSSDATSVIEKKLGELPHSGHSLEHGGIQPYLGYTTTGSDRRLSLITPWYPNGNIRDFVKDNPDSDRFGLLAQAADGLNYLHQKGVVYSDIKMENILIKDDGSAVLCDVGWTHFIESLNLGSLTFGRSGDVRRLAPEFIKDGKSTFQSDVYSFACVALEIISGKAPFMSFKNDVEVLLALHRKEMPLPSNYPDMGDMNIDKRVWDLLIQCWSHDPLLRPSMGMVTNTIASRPEEALPGIQMVTSKVPSIDSHLPQTSRLNASRRSPPKEERGEYVSEKADYSEDYLKTDDPKPAGVCLPYDIGYPAPSGSTLGGWESWLEEGLAFSPFLPDSTDGTSSAMTLADPGFDSPFIEPFIDVSSRSPILSPSKWPRLSAEHSSSSSGLYPLSGSSTAASPFLDAPRKLTGYRRNLTSSDLIPLEAPIQKRNYVFESTTSRKSLPTSVTRTFHPSPGAPGKSGLPSQDNSEQMPSTQSPHVVNDERDEGGTVGSDANDETLKQHVENKRRAGTIAARKSRRRKAEFIEGLRAEVDDLRTEKEQLIEENSQLRARAELAEKELNALRAGLDDDKRTSA